MYSGLFLNGTRKFEILRCLETQQSQVPRFIERLHSSSFEEMVRETPTPGVPQEINLSVYKHRRNLPTPLLALQA